MYHTVKDKEVKPPKGWQFSGDPSFLNLSNSDFNVYFMVVNTRVRMFFQTGLALSEEKNQWEVEEYHGQTGVQIKHERDLSEEEAKEIAVKLAKNLNKEQFMGRFKWVIVPVLLGVLLGALATFIVSNYLLGD